MAQITFSDCPEAREIADRLIPNHHAHLVGVRIEYVLRSDVPKKNGSEVWGTCRKISSLSAYLASGAVDEETGEVSEEGEPFFCITLSQPVWEAIDEKTKVALVDHELCHAAAFWATDLEGVRRLAQIRIRNHDLEEFREIVQRHGFWKPAVKHFARVAAEQLELELEEKTRTTLSVNGGPEIDLDRAMAQVRRAALGVHPHATP